MRIMAIATLLLTKFSCASGGWTGVVDHNEKGVLRIGHAHHTMCTAALHDCFAQRATRLQQI